MPIHLFVVHFAVALVLVGAGLDTLGAAARSRETRRWGGYLLLLGAAAVLLAFWTGQGALNALLATSPVAYLPRAEAHTQWGAAGTWPIAITATLRALWRTRLEGAYGWLNLALAIVAAAVVVGIALSGTAVRHGS